MIKGRLARQTTMPHVRGRAAVRDGSLATRIVLLIAAFVVPLAGAAVFLIDQQTARIAASGRERTAFVATSEGLRAVAALRRLHRELALDGRASRGSYVRARTAVEQFIAAGPMRSADAVDALRTRWRDAERAGSARAVGAVLASVEAALAGIDGRSAVAASANPAVDDLFDADVLALPAIADRTDRAALLLATRTAPSGAARERAANFVGQALYAHGDATADLADASAAGADTRETAPLLADVGRLAAGLPAVASSGARRTGAVRSRDEATLVATMRTAASIDALLDRLLGARERLERRDLQLLVLLAVLAVLVAVSLAMLLARTVRDRDRRELGRARDETSRLAAELARQRELEALAVTEAHMRAVFDRSSIGVAILDTDGRLVRGNRALHEVFGAIDPDRIGGADPNFARLLAGKIESFTTEVHAAQGPEAWFEATLSLVRDDAASPRFAIAMLKDVTERKRTDDRFRFEATHDALSGLPNRTYFTDRLRTLAASPSPPGTHAVLFVDLDEFKDVNDSLGHAQGDRVLVACGERLRRCAGEHDVVARFGGDEFAVLLVGRADGAEVASAAHRFGRALAEPLVLDGRDIYVTASIGVRLLRPDDRSLEEILRDADTAMYHAKAEGRARSAVFDAAMLEGSARRIAVATQLRRALERDELSLAYQPVVALASRRIRSCEVLLRWRHPELGDVSPAEFIPVAEEIGLIVPLGRFVLDRACAQFAAWKRMEPADRPQRVSVNASVREIVQPDYVDFVERTVLAYGLSPGELVLEITESAVLASGKVSSGTLERLKAAGVGLAIDDFGTGYSSLRYLQQFPFDELKIDRSFVGGSDGRLASEAIVAMVLSLATAVGVTVVAEGVETAVQAARLRGLGCANAQGWHFGRPSAARDIPALCRAVTLGAGR